MKNHWLPIVFSFALFACQHAGDEKKASFRLDTITSPADTVSGEPYLFTNSRKEVYLSWVQTKHDSAYLKFTKLDQGRWSIPQTVAKGNNWFINWADYPMVTSGSKQHMMAHFLEKSGSGTYAYDIKITHSTNGGASWSAPLTLHDDGKQAEHGFVTTLPYQNNYFVFWLDGRNTVLADTSSQHDHSGGHGAGAMTLRAALLDSIGTKIEEWLLDDRVCDCCQTTAAITENGPVVIYRDRSEREIRDMSIIRWEDTTWTQPKTIYADNWKIAGCPVNGPRVASLNKTLAVAWFSAPEGKAQVKLAFSEDEGISFHKPIRIGTDKAIGRVGVILINEQDAVVSWMEGNNINAVKVNQSGTKSPTVTIASSSEARASGFPQMTHRDNEIIFAWTDHEKKNIKTAVLTNF
ncbi:exo-alpha-sialidase [Fulvivirga sp. 29W222]|uniref:Exo-alpha-sialidase n=1 Tax=Fulvivirga marina TaxID=2494733 RepID=A0A937G3D1_9BACT|nr:exo-alpha-sialidase [Fulvivirga marina]MBL6449250.1 exo-alpha-sialidase [Fulvivirga marina]